MNEKTPKILHEWGRFDFNTGETNDNLLRLSIISRKNSFYLQPLTKKGYYGVDGANRNGFDREYLLHKTIEQIINLTAEEALQLYYDAEKQYQEAS